MFENKTSITPFAQTESPGDTNILLAILPFWNPLIPPMGISCLKSYLQPYGYQVKTIDANIELQFREVYDDYFNSLQQYIPGHKKGNFYNIGNDVLQNHMMAHLNYEDEKEYVNLVKILVYQTFCYHINDSQAMKFNNIIHEFYTRLEKYVLKLLETEKPAVLGLSVYRATAAASLFAFKLAKAYYPHIKTVMGGGIFSGELSLGSPNFDFFLKNTPFIDKIIVGEGEELFLRFLQNKLPQTQRVYTLKDLDNRVLALDTLNIPDFSDFDTRYYPVLAAYASRSCPFQCTFCAEKVLWGKYRKKNARHIAEEMVQASKKYNCQLFLMTDSLLNPVIKELSSELLKIGDSIYWDGYLRADQAVCDPESTFQWRRGGFYRARLGLESGSQRILAAMKKNITPHQIKEAVTSLAHAGIKTTTYWIIGYPGETEDDFQQTLELIKELKNDIYEADCNPFSYFLTGQVASDEWREKNQSTLLYPESARDMLIIRTWIMAGEPSREETYQRINRFVNHCKKLGIPNPYSLQEIYQADERWKELHKNTVPSLVELMEARNNQTRFIEENKKSKSWLVDRTPSSMIEHGENQTEVPMKTTHYSKKIAFTVSQNVKERDYWLNQLSDKLTKTCFPRDPKKTAGNDHQSPKKDAVRFRLEGDLFSRLIHLSNQSDFRLHIVMVTGIVALLHKYTGSRDILLGAPIYKQEVRGELINTVLVLRNQVNNGMTFKDLLLQVGQTILEANENQNYPIETLLYQLNLPVLADECPLFDAAVLLENIHDKSYLHPVNPAVIFSFLRTPECIEGMVEYQPLLFDQTTIEIIISHFTILLEQTITDLNCSLPGINILSQKEKTRLLMDFNDNTAAFPKDKTILHFIEKYADKAPERTAILFEGTEVSYRSLNQRANRLARVLRKRGIQADEPVGILLNRSPRMAESILAVWKAGGAYIPMEPDYPAKRIIEILNDSHAKVLLTGADYVKKGLASVCNHKIIDPDQYAKEIEKQDTSNPGIDINMKNLAYIIYTSGSTGKPKGVMVEHLGMMNHIYAKINDLHLSGKSVVAQNASHTFDISVWQFFTALTLGGKTVIYPNQLVLESVLFVHRLIQDRVTILEVVPSYLSVMLETLEPGKIPPMDYLLVTGEALKPDLVKQWFEKFPGIKMVNAYGPTEASDDITHHILDKPPAADRVPIGKPVQNLNIYIVDEHMQLCPFRVKGEICVSGVGVGRGYLNNPQLTSERFINYKIQNTMPLSIKKAGAESITNYNVQNYKPNSIHASTQSCNHAARHPIPPLPHSPIYRAGDMGSWLPDGTIEFFGRKDYQVKIRGFRIELGEIETKLETHSNVKEAVVVDREDAKGNKYLCAYLVTRGTLSVPDIKTYLSERLPQYMVPAHFLGLKKMPLTPNGKIDRKALPEPVMEVTAAAPYITYITEEMLKNVEITREERSDSKILIEQEINQNQQHILTEKEKHQLLYTFNDTKADYPKDKTLHQLFEEQVEKIPHHTALVYEDRWITYRELNRRANRLARFLQAKGLEIGGIAGLLMDRSIEMIVSIFAILKAGGAYLPLDAETPKNRTISMLEDCRASMILTTNSDIADYSFFQPQRFQQAEANPYLTPPRPQITQLDELPFPNRSLLDYEKYSQHIGQALVKNSIALQSTRGCPFKCTFCHKIWPKTHMVRSAENLFAEVRKLYNLGIRRFSFVDDVFNFNKKNSARFFQLIIENGLDLQLFFPNGMRGDILTKNYIDLMVKAGTVSIALALETASPRLQKFIGKNLDIKKLRENLEYICETYPDVILEMYNMHGFPTETQEEAQMTLDFLKRIKWVHFPYLAILKIYPKTDMEKLALTHGISREAIERSASLAGHELPETLPFDKKFTLKFQAQFLHDYFLLKERLLHVLPFQMNILSEDEIVQKYNSYLPVEIKSFDDLLEFVNISIEELGGESCQEHDRFLVPCLNEKIRQAFPMEKPAANALKVLLLDLSLYFTAERGNMLYDIPSPPLGLMYLMTYLKREYGPRINGKVAKSRMDFDNFEELKRLVKDFNPDVIGIRSLTFFRDFFHKTAAMIRNWGIQVPIIADGHYATSEFETILRDRNIDLVVRGEGEVTFNQLIGKILENGGRLPDEAVLRNIRGLAFVPAKFERTAQLARDVILVDQFNDNQSQPEKTGANLELPVQPSNLAYVIFTSGSTGKPKGVMIENRSVVNFIKGMTNIIDFSANDVILSLVTISFDIFVLEALLPLTTVSRVVIGNLDQQLDTRATIRVINREQITIFQGTPSMVQWLTADSQCVWGLKGLKYLIVGGEIFPEALLERLKKIVGGKIFNVYGPTETTVWSTAKNVSGQEKLNIGKPIANTQIYIRNRSGEVLPIGVTGELCIGGDGVARGYLNRPELTAKKFLLINNRSNKSHMSYISKKLYKTGDLARWLTDGNIEFLGRRDHQVKIRGLRIELGEIESLLLEYQWITEAVVVVKKHKGSGINDVDSGDKYLCAYFVTSKPILETELREHLSGQLPPYLIPSSFARLEKMPLTPNGKLNRRLLEVLDVSTGSEIKKQGPTDEIERKMVELWSNILGINEENIGIEDNFFQLGGHSLKLTVLIARMHKEFHVNVPLAEGFAAPTVKELCQYIKGASEAKYASIKAVEKKEYYPLSSAQKRLYVLQQMEPDSIDYNMPEFYIMEGEIEREKVEHTFRQLVKRHESLRTSFVSLEEQPVQRIHEEVAFGIEYEEAAQEKVHGILETLVRAFDLSRVPLLRFGLIKISESKHIVMLDMHHIISDGVSDHIFVSDLMALFAGRSLPPLKLQYRDFSQWQNHLIESGKLKQQEEYWLKIFSGEIPVLNLPTDYVRPVVRSFEGSIVSFTIDTDEAAALKDLVLKEGCTLFIVLLSIFSILLAKLSDQADIVIGTSIGGRRHADLENIIGMFVNTLALRTKPFGEKTFKTFLPEVKEQVLQAHENQDYQFEELVKKVAVNRDVSRNPVFDVMFGHQNDPIQKVEISSLELKHYPYDTRITKFDLTLYSLELEKTVELTFGYSSNLFKNETIQRFIGYFKRIVTAILREPKKKISELEILSEKEKYKLLYDFNDTKARYPKNQTIHALFARQIEKIPDSIAVVEEDVVIGHQVFVTYRVLNRQANRLAGILREKGVKPGIICAVMAEPSQKMILKLLAVLKIGAAYLPLDPRYPKERIQYMLKDSHANTLLIQGEKYCTFEEIKFENHLLDLSSEESWKELTAPTELAYVIYTSGSTGKPKGVMVEHRNVVRLVKGTNYIHLTVGDRLLLTGSMAFDITTFEVWCPLLNGLTLYLAEQRLILEAGQLEKRLTKNNISLLHLIPQLFNQQVDFYPGIFRDLRCLLVGGDMVTPGYINKARKEYKELEILHMYGPTENTTFSTFFPIEKVHDRSIPIGKPISNSSVYILDKHGKLQPIGVNGELCTGGEGVARGYLNNPELTAEKFIEKVTGAGYRCKWGTSSNKKFLRVFHGTGAVFIKRAPGSRRQRLYKSGDLARWLDDGNIEFLGRMDTQVKIRGFRIEPGEIEKVLCSHDKIEECVVSPREVNGENRLLAYYKEKNKIMLWPSLAEYFIYDDLIYNAMVRDEGRNEKYRNAIEKVAKGKILLEIGPGAEAILSRMCIEAGAKKVYAVEILADAYEKARKTIKQLNLADKIILIRGDITKVELPEKVDGCVSEIVGTIGGAEGAAAIINSARKWLKDPARMIPARSITHIAALTLPVDEFDYSFDELGSYYTKKIFNHYGNQFDLRLSLLSLSKKNIISNSDIFEELDFTRENPLEEEHEIRLEITHNSILNGFVVWLDLYCDEKEVISTLEKKYIWLPIYFPVFSPGEAVREGDIIKANVIRTLSANHLNPDFTLKGTLYKKHQDKTISFTYEAPHQPLTFKSNHFYRQVFATDQLKVTREITSKDLRRFLEMKIPDYMTPTYFIKIENIPLNPNGKVDRKALPQPQMIAGENYIPPGDALERKLLSIWFEVLNVNKEVISMDSNFFELGGHSLKAIRLTSKIHKGLNVKVPLAEIFKNPTIRGLSRYIKEAVENKYASIEAVEKREYYPLSSAQKRLYILWQFETQRLSYNMPIVVLLVGELERERFKNSLERIITRHESFRTSFEMIAGSPVQKVYPFHELVFSVSYYKSKKESANPIINDFIKPFDLSRAPLLRVGLIKIEAGRHILMVDMHHIISDGSSMTLFVKDFIRLYEGSGSDLPPLRLQYKDYSHWHNKEKRGKSLVKQEAYWSKVLAGEIPVLNLPVDYTRPVMQSSEGNALGFEIGPGKTQTLKKLALNEDVTLYMVLLAIFNILLSKLSCQEDIVVGTPVEGRRNADLQPIIGMFVNTLALRNYPERSQTFKVFLRELRQHTLDAFENQEYQFEDLVSRLNVKRNPNRNPLFDVMFQFNTNDVPAVQIPGLKLQPYGNFHPFSKFDINLKVVESADRLLFSVEYCTKLFKVETIELFIENFNRIVSSILEDPEKKLSRIERISPEKKKTILAQFNQELYKSPTPPTLQEKLTENFQKYVNRSALEYGSLTITYTALQHRSDNITWWIINKGIKKQTFIGILLENHMDLTAAVIGILKAGCVFIPLDTDYPEDRLEMMIRHIDIRFIICDNINFNRLADCHFIRCQAQYAPEFMIIEGLLSPPQSGDLPLVQYRPEDNIYVYFTSGSTGTPKAFIGKNQSLLNFIQWEIETFKINSDFRVSQLTTPGFDAFLRDVFVPLCTGGVICIPGNKDILLNPGALINWLDQSGVHLIHCIPSLFRLINSNTLTENHFKNLKFVLFSGERINPPDLAQWYETFAERIQLVNLWGTSETTLAKTFYFIRPPDIHRERIPVGKPMEGARVIILDKQMEVCDYLVTGEIYILTPYRTAGYCNAPGLNKERFIRNTFKNSSLDFMHKTGDLGRFLPDGNIDLLGRNDRQVKIRGIRVELEEIESLLVRHGRVKEAVVVKREISVGSELLWAYVALRDSSEGEKQTGEESLVKELENHLAAKLPTYMVPANIMVMEKIPRTPRGKVDYRVLPDPLTQNRAHHIPPRDEIEKALCSMWSEILKFHPEKISIIHRFFELGGNSLNAMALISKIHKAFNVKFPLVEVFVKVTIEQQAEFIRNAQEYQYAEIKSVEAKEYYPLSSAQKRIYIVQQMEPGSRTYNMPRTMVLEGEVYKELLEETFIKLIKRHESFRSSFEILQGVPVQRIYQRVPFAMDYFEAEEKEAQPIVNSYIRPFDLSQAPNLRVGLIKTAEARHILIVEMHHIISDGASLELFVKDFLTLYRGEELTPLRIQYKDFSQWRNSKEERESVKNQEAYWLRQFERDIPVLNNLPTDYARPAIRKFEGSTTSFYIETDETEKLKALALNEEATLYMVLLAIFNVLLSRISGQEDIVIGTGVEGRRHADLEKIIGMFVNTLAIRSFPRGEKSFRQFLQEIKQNTLEAFENQEYPFEELVEKVTVNRDTSRNPLFDVSFQVENIQAPKTDIASTGIRVMPHGYDRKISRFDLTLQASETANLLGFSIAYNTSLFKEETIERLMMYFPRIISSVVSAPGKKISEIEMISKKGKEELLFQLNQALDNEIKQFHSKQYVTLQDKLNVNLSLFKDNIAITYGDQYITCAELDKRSDYMAYWMMNNGISNQTYIGLSVNNRITLIITMVAVLKAGCVFIPLETAQHENRLQMMIHSLDLQYVMTDNPMISQIGKAGFMEGHNPEFILMEELLGPGGWGPGLSQYRDSNEHTNRPGIKYGGEDQIYVYFTSGTTGIPRAMVGKNLSLLHFVQWEIATFGIKQGDRVSQLTTPGFDAFLRDVFVPLCSGGVICIPTSKEILMDSDSLINWIEKFRVRLIHCVPSLFRLLASPTSTLTANHFKELKYVLLSGEPIHPSDLVQWYETFDERIQLVNLWGTSETTLAKTCYFIGKSDIYRERIPVGQPITGAGAMILNNEMNLCGEFLTGEIYIITPFRTLGYCNDPDLTGDRFLPNPFNDKSQLRMHKTGDLGRLLPDGNIDLLGRNDRQVKIRGIRVELEEIESLLVRDGRVKEAVAVKREISGGSELLQAYVALRDSSKGEKQTGEESLVKELENHLAAKLPAYMVPANIMVMEKIPRTPRGKVDYRVLPDPLTQNRTHHIPPRDEIEKALCSMWSEILKFHPEKISINHRFFELGGNSLNAMALISKIHKAFNVKFPLVEVFVKVTIEQQAEFIRNAQEYQYAEIKSVEEKEYYPLSSAQKQIYILQQMEPESKTYNMPWTMVLEGEVDKERLEETFMKLIKRQESFRSSFEMRQEVPVQRIYRQVPFVVDYFEAEEKEAHHIVNRYIRPFDLSRAPILRVGLIKAAPTRHILIVEMHHIISDATSLALFVKDFMTLYRGEELPLLRVQYKDFSQWRNSKEERESIKNQEAYWLGQFKDRVPPVLNLPIDYARPAIQKFDGSTTSFGIETEETEKLKALALKEETTLYMVLLAIFNILLYRISGQEDIVVGTDIEGRRHADLEKIIGMFVNTLAMRSFPRGEKSFRQFLQEIKQNTLEAFENQEYPFDQLVKQVVINRDLSRNPLFDVMFSFRKPETSRTGKPDVDVSGLKQRIYNYQHTTAKFDLMLSSAELPGELVFSFEYCTKLFKRKKIDIFVILFKEIVSSVLENSQIKLGAIEISLPLLVEKKEEVTLDALDF